MKTSSQIFLSANHTYERGLDRPNLVASKLIFHSAASVFTKRTMDIVLSFGLLSVLLPVAFPIIAVWVMLDSKGGVFFKQKRTGYKKTSFTCFKLRTMYLDRTSSDGSSELKITRFGMFLRKTHIDELPQLLNILLGQMSLVGPRPHMLSDTEEFESQISNYHLRHAVKPGITGLAQVNGFYGNVSDNEHLLKRIQNDIEYVYNWNTVGDVKIMLLTLKESFVNKD